MRLKDKVILITGSTTGIGESMARLFAREGAYVFVHGTREKAAQEIVREISENGGMASYLVHTLEDPAAPRQMIQEIATKAGRINALVNNAAIITHGDLETTTQEAFDRAIAVNLRAPFLLAHEAYPYFCRQGGGRILNIGSINAYCGERNLLPYSISKGGLMTLTRNLADAYGSKGLRVNALNVGWTLTPNEYALKRADGLPENWPDHLPATYAPSGRLLRPEEIAAAALFFLSDEASLINGAVLDLEQFPVIGRNPAKEGE